MNKMKKKEDEKIMWASHKKNGNSLKTKRNGNNRKNIEAMNVLMCSDYF